MKHVAPMTFFQPYPDQYEFENVHKPARLSSAKVAQPNGSSSWEHSDPHHPHGLRTKVGERQAEGRPSLCGPSVFLALATSPCCSSFGPHPFFFQNWVLIVARASLGQESTFDQPPKITFSIKSRVGRFKSRGGISSGQRVSSSRPGSGSAL